MNSISFLKRLLLEWAMNLRRNHHPLGMSGTRLVITATRELKKRGGRYALCTMCVGVGQGVALILENLN